MIEDNIEMLDKEIFNEFFDNLLKVKDKKILKSGFCEYTLTEQQINLIVRPDCNQKCEYCYLYQHGDELYPTKISKEETLKNVELFIDYIYNVQKVFPYTWEFFAGDLFYDDIFFDIMDIFDKYLDKIQKKYPELFIRNHYQVATERERLFVIPSNLSFVYTHPEKAEKAIEYVKYFRKKYDVRIMFSWSTDGPYCTDWREKKDLNQEYFDTILDFCIKTESGSHPMVAPENVKYWIENYDWWLDMTKQLNEKTGNKGDFQPMMLEVRNANWTEENIEDYKKFLDYLMEIRLEKLDGDIEKLAYHFFVNSNEEDSPVRVNQYDPLKFNWKRGISNGIESLGCNLFSGLHFNCTNLSLSICHRLTYTHLTTVYFIPDEKKEHIIDFKPQNISAFIAIRTLKDFNAPLCAGCPLNSICLQGCLGSQFEFTGELLLPIPSVCAFFREKYRHIIDLYENLGLFEIALQKEYIKKEFYEDIQRIKFILNQGKE